MHSRRYRYRNLSIVDVGSQAWAVIGFDKISNGSGVLEWCYNEKDARETFDLMRQSGEFLNLKYCLY
jgi:hypothetical protein